MGGGQAGGSAPGVVPTCVGSRDMAVGQLFGLGWCGDALAPWTLACGGSKATLGVWMIDESAALEARFTPRLTPAAQAVLAATGGGFAAAASEAAGAVAGVGALSDMAAAAAMPGGGGEGEGAAANAKKKTKKKGTKKATQAK